MIYLGREIPNSRFEVSDKALYDFLDQQHFLDSFTIWRCEGYWRGGREQTVVIEVFDTDIDNVRKFMKLYKAEFQQQGVYLKSIPVQTELF
jgi:Protein of unknown function (DUF3574)